jgi:hypothetical protein
LTGNFAVNSLACCLPHHAFWTAGERASGSPGSPVTPFLADYFERLQRLLTGDFAATSLTCCLPRHASWTAGECANGSPSSPVAPLAATYSGRLQRLWTGIFTVTPPTCCWPHHVFWTAGERASDSPGSPVAPLTDTPGSSQHFFYFSVCLFNMADVDGKYFSWDRAESQAFWPQYGYCVCKGCQQYRRDKSVKGCIDCARANHLVGDISCPRHTSTAEDSFAQGLAAKATDAAFSLIFLPTPSQTPSVMARQSVGIDGDNT